MKFRRYRPFKIPSLDRSIDGRDSFEVFQAIEQLNDACSKHNDDLSSRHAAQKDRKRLVRKAISMEWSLEFMATKKGSNQAKPPVKAPQQKRAMPRIPVSLDSLEKLERLVVRFIDGHRISSAESIVQNGGISQKDTVEFIENLATLMGYYRGE